MEWPFLYYDKANDLAYSLAAAPISGCGRAIKPHVLDGIQTWPDYSKLYNILLALGLIAGGSEIPARHSSFPSNHLVGRL